MSVHVVIIMKDIINTNIWELLTLKLTIEYLQ